ncbi:hypothetical protein [Nostoc sp.]|uniref:hypothetical protein n=1 Tax=Nostoc sp. TaxID=1180 RepID=UPI002FFC2C21
MGNSLQSNGKVNQPLPDPYAALRFRNYHLMRPFFSIWHERGKTSTFSTRRTRIRSVQVKASRSVTTCPLPTLSTRRCA